MQVVGVELTSYSLRMSRMVPRSMPRLRAASSLHQDGIAYRLSPGTSEALEVEVAVGSA